MLRTFKIAHGDDLSRFAEFYAVQLNDTHPAMSIPELIRLLMAEGMRFCRKVKKIRYCFLISAAIHSDIPLQHECVRLA